MRVKKILVPVIITSTVLIASCGSRQPVEEAMTQQTESETSITLFNASNGITPETAVAEAENTEPATTVNPEIQEIADYVNNMDIKTESEPAEDIPVVDSVYGKEPQPTESTIESTTPIQENTPPSNSNTSTSNVLKPLTEEEKEAALKEVVSDIPEAASVDNYTVTDMAQTMYVIDGGYIREAPSTNANIIRAFWGDERTINVYGKVNEGNWYKVFVPMRNGENTYGYVSGTLLSETNPLINEAVTIPENWNSNTNPKTGAEWVPGEEVIIIDPYGDVIRGGYGGSITGN
ncbi:MAG: SH3 domain-containing protein [Lachnospiraceae bacterium]|nr:SH3 domain-containing protein [Lachnospiraceae bacterium]